MNEVDVAVKMMKENSMMEEDFIDEAMTMMYAISIILCMPICMIAHQSASVCPYESLPTHPLVFVHMYACPPTC